VCRCSVSCPARKSNTSLLTAVLLQTTMKTGGVRPLARPSWSPSQAAWCRW
jgi:hypothetical protein